MGAVDQIQRLRILVLLLRLAGGVTVMGFIAVFLPADWMASTHRWLGLGQFPQTPVVDYLTRSIAALYGYHGVLNFMVARDPIKYRPFVWFLAFMNISFGLMLIGIDWGAGLPWFWRVAEGPPMLALGLLIAWLNRSISPYPARTV